MVVGKKVGIVGVGTIGVGVAKVCAAGGHEVTLFDLVPEKALKVADEISAAGSPERARVAKSLKALANCDIILEALPEDLTAKVELFRELVHKGCKPSFWATATSSLSVNGMARDAELKVSLIRMHFLNPPDKMKLVEVTYSAGTDPKTADAAKEFLASLGKSAVTSTGKSGLIAYYLYVPFLNDAIRIYEKGLASAEDIDKGCCLGLGYPVGPLHYLDAMGLDAFLQITSNLYEQYKDQGFASPHLLQQKVEAGELGCKTGKGFFAY
ncbi:MAG TPA: 3-hydroxyacyl-CoA dehydrogenase NAD-binding domain-containing protein [Syntrophales bacterium]|nr:3-hydroxyacyl-CoA dehydrogenase NAD-binding domain-containing protein [Syntrophales bacterium]